MASNDILPNQDAKFDNFQSNLVSIVTTNATAWGITTGEIDALTDAQTPWTDTWLVAKVKTNRTSAQIKAKDDARKAYSAVLRPFIQTRIQLNPLLTDADKLTCGIKPRDTVRTRIPAPNATPQITLLNGAGNSMSLYFSPPRGEDGSSSRGKPKGVAAIKLAVQMGGDAPNSPEDCRNTLTLTRSPKRFSSDPGKAGQSIYVFGCWLNAKGEEGPWSSLVQGIMT